ncbi:MAG: hypothetical protein ABR987_14085 [Terracidiphilus sp.]|jgi:hypothetical protein
MGSLVASMTQEFYGFGRWDAPYWFIGPEPGGEGNEMRAEAFKKLGKDGLCDCKEFHEEIGEMRWHREAPEAAVLQRTWRRLILLLMASLHEPSDQESLRSYQRDHWGRSAGNTCVVELSGLSARNSQESKKNKGYLDKKAEIVEARIKTIRERMSLDKLKPRLVVMYGFSEEKNWSRIAGCDLTRGGAEKHESTIFVLAPHPNARGPKDDNWKQLAEKVANKLDSMKGTGFSPYIKTAKGTGL